MAQLLEGPRIKLVAITQFVDPGGTLDEFAAYAGSICYRTIPREGDAATAFVMLRAGEGHDTLLQHASASFLFEDVSRAFTHQLVRHRMADYSQESQRYVDMGEPDFVVPPAIVKNGEALAVWIEATAQVADVYRKLRSVGILKEDARFLLPNATATRILATMNFGAWRHFIEVRCAKAAQWEIRRVALEILKILHSYSPGVFQDLYDKFIEGE